ncbi:hypothetical protein [Streptomyces sp. BE303]|uniref:hypothetical protein n=1 Tax=Streptomyces sp. BE303 TaxID=3002528 RepID=UPI002E779B06|nr:hypothetical protein [Streptomyces sp. BE303]MED7952665.1 hypothetical protein [Streptomyces sp. BE303]
MPSSHPGRRKTRLTAALLLISAVACTARVLEVALSTGLDPVRARVGELAAAGLPLGGLSPAAEAAGADPSRESGPG